MDFTSCVGNYGAVLFSHRQSDDEKYVPGKGALMFIYPNSSEPSITEFVKSVEGSGAYRNITVNGMINVNRYKVPGYSELIINVHWGDAPKSKYFIWTILSNDRKVFGPKLDEFLSNRGLRRVGLKTTGGVVRFGIEVM